VLSARHDVLRERQAGVVLRPWSALQGRRMLLREGRDQVRNTMLQDEERDLLPRQDLLQEEDRDLLWRNVLQF
jgi:hypothetical protein